MTDRDNSLDVTITRAEYERLLSELRGIRAMVFNLTPNRGYCQFDMHAFSRCSNPPAVGDRCDCGMVEWRIKDAVPA